MLKLIVKTIGGELERRKEVRFLEDRRRRIWKEADIAKDKAIEAYRNEKYMIGKTYMKTHDRAISEVLELQDKINNLTKE